ncbi:MAG: HAD family hydrolase [Candidatus Thiodiazotropha sp. (ex Ctena orbiculata)]|nr:HAD family hydrolase [Candidatus Thiodiazotropha taylori]MBT2998664.1 HAD family hydrolase [Candidatus Thiodiazotropha taylori]MBT3002778.1 HAD family hydrolase [Candidatus Thiodiazotropha taylori]MBV2108706.1 HAD family hydrolase [Candidatus Thiodiazotropha taylori]MBV2113116.1 HAD family hydrolase [Candidatus Thiodiazotropha taylori]
MLAQKKAMLLDMNNTFMFGEDRFGESEDFSIHYVKIGGTLPGIEINTIVRTVYIYMDTRYSDVTYRHNFPSLEYAIREIVNEPLSRDEINKIVDTFTYHELGYIPAEYAEALHKLRHYFLLAAVIDIWSPKTAWLKEFERAGIHGLFSAISFSSDHGMVKPSPKPFELVLGQLETARSEAVVVGDSPTRDLSGAKSAGIDCILVGGSEHPDTVATFSSLLDLCDAIQT